MFKRAIAQRNWLGLSSISLTLILAVVLLSACEETKSPDEIQHIVGTAIAKDGATPAPTLNQANFVSVSAVILNAHDYYPANPGEEIDSIIVNENATSVYAGTCGMPVLQRQEADKWIDIGPGQPCAPGGAEIVQLPQFSKAFTANFPFDLTKTKPFAGQSWTIPGVYRLFFTYYLKCPSGSQLLKDCLDPVSVASDPFLIKSGTTVTILPNPNYTPGSELTPRATPR
jgi:hypothetical protein